VLDELDRSGRARDTLIIFTSDHGDHLGDHGLGEKELFYEQAVRVPMIVVDPRPDAAATRGTVSDAFVESVDIVPTILDALGLDPAPHVVEGRSLLPLLEGRGAHGWRDAVFSELDYSFRAARLRLGRTVDECQAWMVRTDRWKYVHWQGMRPQLFDMRSDPDELVDLGDAPGHEAVRAEMKDRLFDWMLRSKTRTTVDHATVERRTEDWRGNGLFIGVW
jgi:arylsulfatase A-like enzyme